MVDTYLAAVNEHLDETRETLDELCRIATHGVLSTIEQRAAERTLQIAIEAAIGLAKHWIKQASKQAPSDAYQTFQKLQQQQKIGSDDLIKWKKIIGLRNAIVHDYLMVDNAIIMDVLRHRYYEDVFDFADKAILAQRQMS